MAAILKGQYLDVESVITLLTINLLKCLLLFSKRAKIYNGLGHTDDSQKSNNLEIPEEFVAKRITAQKEALK
ncbi:hypothetical protein [Fictibacillus sp. KU28468]|uniref:hypothetical protein n=1 Tax=Fictibacillus sp. KU28468 TaxID=2991053 RepID=UPI00223E69B0|nr:hypothetical protein [Fictibacillus sp. KU28468]UZJ80507.1 hypothetical protein OKX00_08655 [Fictibacillus sp. KU28468]